jgi:hypothetical protein
MPPEAYEKILYTMHIHKYRFVIGNEYGDESEFLPKIMKTDECF